MVRRRRLLSRLVALPVACVMLAGATDLLHPRAWDVCELVPATHDALAHRWSAEAPRGHADGEHCYLCHSMRLFGSALALTRRPIADGASSNRARVEVLLPRGRQISSRLPARSPPLS